MHRHIWKIQSQFQQPSAWEQVTKGVTTAQFGETSLPGQAFEKPVIVTYHCEVCGAEKVQRV